MFQTTGSTQLPPRVGIGVLLFILAAVAIGKLLQDGNWNDPANNHYPYPILTAVLGATLLAVLAPRFGLLPVRWGRPVLLVVLGLGLAYAFSQLFGAPPGTYLRLRGPFPLAQFHTGLGVAAFLAGATLFGKRSAARVAFALLLAVHFWLCMWMIEVSPSPHIDVFVWHHEALSRLAAGVNPFVGTLPNIYGNELAYGEGMGANGQVLTGFPYPPLSLLLAGLGRWVGGDYRYALALAMTATGALIGFSRPGPVSFGAAALMLFSPRAFFVVEQGWTDSFALLLVGAIAALSRWRPKWVPVAFGLLVVIKQYLVFGAVGIAAPSTPLVLPERIPVHGGGRRRGARDVASLPAVAIPARSSIRWSPSIPASRSGRTASATW